MNYELALKLKDAGFPQMGDGFALVVDNPAPFEDEVDATVSVIPWCQYVLCPSETYGPTIYSPTLSELIEACGEGDFQLRRTKMWHAVIQKGDMPSHDWQHGESPEEAVSMLWLSLNKKGE